MGTQFFRRHFAFFGHSQGLAGEGNPASRSFLGNSSR
jgi:hypothetical protein